VGGIGFGVSGFHFRRGSLAARRVAQANAIFGYIWVVAYSISCYQTMDIIGPSPDVLPESASTVFQWFSIIVSTLIGSTSPAGSLHILSRPEDQDATMAPERVEQVGG
jgi:hypothetical protein